MIEIEFEKNKRVVLIIVKQGPKRTGNMKDVIIIFFFTKTEVLSGVSANKRTRNMKDVFFQNYYKDKVA